MLLCFRGRGAGNAIVLAIFESICVFTAVVAQEGLTVSRTGHSV